MDEDSDEVLEARRDQWLIIDVVVIPPQDDLNLQLSDTEPEIFKNYFEQPDSQASSSSEEFHFGKTLAKVRNNSLYPMNWSSSRQWLQS